MRLIHAAGIVTGAREWVDAGLVVSEDKGVLAVGPIAGVRAGYSDVPVTRVDGVVFPGLVNAHTHLELSGIHGKIPEGLGFLAWLDALMKLPREQASAADAPTPDPMRAACNALRGFATELVGEITNTRRAVPFMREAGLGGVVFDEVFGLDRERTMARLSEVTSLAFTDGMLRSAATPHALHSVHPDTLRALAARSSPCSVHLAEYPEERQYLCSGEGPLADWLAARGQLPPSPHKPSLVYAAELGLLRKGTLAVHLTDATRDELAVLKSTGATAVLCPRSNLYIEGKLPPLQDIIALDLPFALGTDSLASNHSLDVLMEARTLHEAFPEVSTLMLLRAATLEGAVALGRGECGHLEVGSRARVYAVDGQLGQNSPSAFLLRNTHKERVLLS